MKYLIILLLAFNFSAHAGEFQEAEKLENRGWYYQAYGKYEKLSKLGNQDALYKIGTFYEHGTGAEKNPKKAIEIYESLIKADYLKPEERLGYIYLTGSDFKFKELLDVKKAFYWYGRAANRGSLDAQLRFAIMHMEGQGTRPDALETYKWLLIALEHDDGRAKNALSVLDKRFTENDKKIAYDRYLKYKKEKAKK